MADQLQLRGGTTAENNAFTGAPREVTVDVEKRTLVVHDGATPGGNSMLTVEQVATNAQAIAGTAGVLPDAAGVHASFGQYGLGSKGTTLGDNFDFNSPAAFIDGSWRVEASPVNGPSWGASYCQFRVTRGDGNTINQTVYAYQNNRISFRNGVTVLGNPQDIRNKPWVDVLTTADGATAAEAQAGTSTEKWISPAALSSRLATETRTGLVEKATTAEAQAGAADKYPDAEGVHAAIRGLAVGTVSQSGGVPTGAIIESGSNVNGQYTKYADGRLICISKAIINRVTLPGEKRNNELIPAAAFVDIALYKSIDFYNDLDGGLPYIYTFTTSLGRAVNSGQIGTGDFSWPPVLGGFTANSEFQTLIAIGRWY